MEESDEEHKQRSLLYFFLVFLELCQRAERQRFDVRRERKATKSLWHALLSPGTRYDRADDYWANTKRFNGILVQ